MQSCSGGTGGVRSAEAHTNNESSDNRTCIRGAPGASGSASIQPKDAFPIELQVREGWKRKDTGATRQTLARETRRLWGGSQTHSSHTKIIAGGL